MAFWPVFRRQRSLIDEILEKQDINLEELLDQDDIIQECRYMNDGLLEYLSNPEIIERLIRYVITKPPELKKGEVDEVGPTRYPFIASELFECGVGAMHNALFDKPELLGLLFSILEQPPPLDPSNVAYFRKVVNVLIQRKFEDLTEYMKEDEKGRKVLGNIVTHIGLHSVLEILNLLTWDDMDGVHISDEHLDWLCEEKLIPRLVEKLDPVYESQPEVHANAAQALVDAALRAPFEHVALRTAFADKDTLKKLFSYLTSKSESSLQHTLSVLIALVQRHIKLNSGVDSDEEFHDPETKAGGDDEQKALEKKRKKPEKKVKTEGDKPADKTKKSPVLPFAELLIEHLPFLLKLLKVDPKSVVITLGRTASRFGPARLKIVELLLWLLRTSDVSIEKKITEHKVLPILFDLFEEHEWHNMLHIRVANAVATIIDGQSIGIQKSLFVDAKILDRLASCYRRNDDLFARPKGTRVGYMGHVIVMSNSIIEWHKELCAQTSSDASFGLQNLDALKELRDIVTKQMESKDWQAMIKERLTVDNERMQVVLGGHRPGDAMIQPPPPAADVNSGGDEDFNLPEDDDDEDEVFNFENDSTLDREVGLNQDMAHGMSPITTTLGATVPITSLAAHPGTHVSGGSTVVAPTPVSASGTGSSSASSFDGEGEDDDVGLPTITNLDLGT